MGFSVVDPVAVDSTVLTSTNVAESEALWLVGTTYGAAAVVYYPVDGIHTRFISVGAGNIGNVPPDSPDDWTDDGPTNRYAMFDETVSTLTTNTTSIAVALTLAATQRIDCLYLAGLDALSVRVQVTDPTAGAVYDETFSLADVSSITDWYAWYFYPVRYLTELLVVDLPYGAASVITVTITKTGGTAACGALVLGLRETLGGTRWGVTTEIRDYSVFEEDEFGTRTLVPRAYRKLASGQAIIENRVKDAIETRLAEGRATVRLYILDDQYSTLVILGTCRWSVEMSLPPSRSLCSLQLESVV